jgi:hypothetical protein
MDMAALGPKTSVSNFAAYLDTNVRFVQGAPRVGGLRRRHTGAAGEP